MNRALDNDRGLRWLAAGLCVTLSLLLPPSAVAQSDAETLADFRACGAVERERARLACFDGVLAADRGAAGPAELADSEPLPETAAAEPRATALETTRAPTPSAERPEPAETRTAALAKTEQAETPTVTIVETNTQLPGAARFVTDDGRVFVQTSGSSSTRGYPSVPFEAALENGAFGSLFLRLGPRLRVRVSSAD